MPTFRVLSPDRGYRSDYLWLPKKFVRNTPGVQAALTFPREQSAPIYAWSEAPNHIVVPREFITFDEYDQLDFPIDDITPEVTGTTRKVQVRNALNSPSQIMATAALVENGNGIIQMACGRGKSVIALHAWTMVQKPILVVVHTQDLLQNWRAEILEQTDIRPEEIGLVQGQSMDWQKPIALAMIQTLAARETDEQLPEELRKHFGVILFDEIHHLGAPFFNQVAALGYGFRWGLSATPDRPDGLTALYQYHVGPVLHEDMSQDLIPECFFVMFDRKPTSEEIDWLYVRGEISTARLYNWLATIEDRNTFICNYVDQARAENRKVIVFSHRVEHLKDLARRYPGCGLIHGGVKGTERRSQLYDHDLVFATTQLAREGLNRKDLDTILVTMPLSDEGMLRQMIGRIQRRLDDKMPPVVVVVEDRLVPPCKKQCGKMKVHLTTFQYPFFEVTP